MDTKRSLAQAKLGFELLDRKRNILIREVMLMIDKAKTIQERIDMTYAEAYLALQQANILVLNPPTLCWMKLILNLMRLKN